MGNHTISLRFTHTSLMGLSMAKTNAPVMPDPIPVKQPLSDGARRTIQALYCAGEKATILANRFDLSVKSIYHMAQRGKWPTPRRITKAASSDSIITNDPAAEVAALWGRRSGEARERTFNGTSKALERFYAMSPIPLSFKEAQIAQDMLDKAVNPDAGAKPGDQSAAITNVNLAFLTNNLSPVPAPLTVDT